MLTSVLAERKALGLCMR